MFFKGVFYAPPHGVQWTKHSPWNRVNILSHESKFKCFSLNILALLWAGEGPLSTKFEINDVDGSSG